MDSQVIEEYQRIYAADPNSRVFAVLAEAYREMGLVEEAERVATQGVTRHPKYAPGLVALGRILSQKNDLTKAIPILQQAIQLSPDNLLAHQLLGESFLKLKRPIDALKAHKMALFISPNNKRSQDVVKKLEALTAEDFEEDFFAMKPLHESPIAEAQALPIESTSTNASAQLNRTLERGLSVVDALMVRQEHLMAKERLEKLASQFPGNPEVEARWQMLEVQQDLESATPLKPLPYREKLVINQKVKRLDKILKAIENRRNENRGATLFEPSSDS